MRSSSSRKTSLVWTKALRPSRHQGWTRRCPPAHSARVLLPRNQNMNLTARHGPGLRPISSRTKAAAAAAAEEEEEEQKRPVGPAWALPTQKRSGLEFTPVTQGCERRSTWRSWSSPSRPWSRSAVRRRGTWSRRGTPSSSSGPTSSGPWSRCCCNSGTAMRGTAVYGSSASQTMSPAPCRSPNTDSFRNPNSRIRGRTNPHVPSMG
mmetsp:Transcript_14385/g.42459  ORF Transcript_14385/g.42459 Transcript_14385/m.42459 type:complete len:207 (+) Transcript_14385:194-814(+)